MARGVLDASGEVVVPRLLAMLAVVAVFVPSFFMTGVSRSLFVPLSLAVGVRDDRVVPAVESLVPVLSVWWLRRTDRDEPNRIATGSSAARSAGVALRGWPARVPPCAAYVVVTVASPSASV
jgi:Cu/Ag efflux pump CusA